MNNSVSVLLIPICRPKALHKTAINGFLLPITVDVQKYLLLCYGKQSMSILNYFHFNRLFFVLLTIKTIMEKGHEFILYGRFY